MSEEGKERSLPVSLSFSHSHHRVENEVAAAKAPPAKRVKSTSDLKQRVVGTLFVCLFVV